MTLAEPTILRSTNAADLLATVPAICGFTARNSVVVIPFVGKRSRGAMRMDLPPSSTAAGIRAVAQTITGMLRRMPDCTGLAVIIYTDETFASRGGIPHLDLWRALAPKLRRTGMQLKEAACVAPDGWASYLDPARPVGGRPLSEITESRMALEAVFVSDELRDIASWNELPDAEPRLARLVAQAEADLGFLGVRVDAFGIEHDADPDPVGLAERMLAVPAAELGAQCLAEIVVTAHVPALRDVLLHALAGGRELGEAALERSLESIRIRGKTGESFDEQALQRIESGERDDDELFMIGMSQRRPGGDRLNRAIEALRQAAAHAPTSRRAGTLCLLTWMLWARGSMTAAHRMHELARDCNPELLMVETLGWLLASGMPQWAFRAPDDTSVQKND